MTRFSFSRGKTRFFEIFFDIFQVLFRRRLSILLAFLPQSLYTVTCVSIFSVFQAGFCIWKNIFVLICILFPCKSICTARFYIHVSMCVYLRAPKTDKRSPGTHRFRDATTIYRITYRSRAHHIVRTTSQFPPSGRYSAGCFPPPRPGLSRSPDPPVPFPALRLFPPPGRSPAPAFSAGPAAPAGAFLPRGSSVFTFPVRCGSAAVRSRPVPGPGLPSRNSCRSCPGIP